MTKYIFVTGGVVSSLGKGIAAASIGLLLKSRGLKVTLQKLDPYINVDPGTMSPYQHGEVYVTEDGAETDLDLGHYERFTGLTMTKDNNVTAGKIYFSVITKERRGDYLGKTVQVVPHITDEIKQSITKLASQGSPDVVIVEVGGTVGDIEGLPFLEAIRQLRLEVGRGNSLNIHLTLVPYIKAADELKTKPTQHSVGKLREIGLQPEILLCRTEKPISDLVRQKIALFCNVEPEAVIQALDVRDVYEVPLMFSRQQLDRTIMRLLDLPIPRPQASPARRSHSPPAPAGATGGPGGRAGSLAEDPVPQPSASGSLAEGSRAHAREAQRGTGEEDLVGWRTQVVERALRPRTTVRIAVVGKYIQLQDAYKSIDEALRHGGLANNVKVEVKRVDSEQLTKEDPAGSLNDVTGILVPGGFGHRGIEGKLEAVHYARERKVPFFGICLGMQCAVIEFARNVLSLKGANSTEFDPKTAHPVISLLEEQHRVTHLGGTMRLGAWPCQVIQGTRAYTAYQRAEVAERHRHRYEFNNTYRGQFEQRGMVFSGLYAKDDLVELVELKDHPWFVAGQFHPEFRSRPLEPHPLFREFVKASLQP